MKSMELIKIQVTVNGSKEILEVPPNLSLLNMLRENLVLTGTKSGCEAGECGACTVLLEGEPVNSCMVLAVECNGLSVETIEGLSEEEPMKKLQQAFMNLMKNAFEALVEAETLNLSFRRDISQLDGLAL